MGQINLNKGVLVFSPNVERLALVEEKLFCEEVDLKLTDDVKDLIFHLDNFDVEKCIVDVDFNGDVVENLKITNAIFTNYFYKYGDKAKEKFVAIVYDEVFEDFFDKMNVPYSRNDDFEFERFLEID